MHLQPDTAPYEYLDTRDRNQDIDVEIADMQANIREVNEGYNQRREELKTYIDKKLSHIHGDQQRELYQEIKAMYDECKAKELALERDLKAKQLAEAQHLKAQYAKLKKEQEEENKALRERVQEKADLKKALQQDLERKRKILSKEQLLAFLDDVSSSRKRPKLEHGGKAGNDEDG
jgi:paraquat-inducible protein B